MITHGWHDWFAWYPVICRNGTIIWLKTTKRRKVTNGLKGTKTYRSWYEYT